MEGPKTIPSEGLLGEIPVGFVMIGRTGQNRLELRKTSSGDTKMGTTLLQSGQVVDGKGSPAFDGHVLLKDDKIAGLFRYGDGLPAADKVLDVKGQVISPGFIDAHSHAEWVLPLEEHPDLLKCFLEQGVTTLVGGNCGYSPAPVRPETLPRLETSLASLLGDKPLDYSWRSVGDFLQHLEEKGVCINLAQLVGHASVRFNFSDTRRGGMSHDEKRGCLEELERSLDQGACGLSFGLGYDPGMYSPQEEIEDFCRVAANANKPVTVHLKALSRVSPTYPITYYKPHNLRALREMILVAQKTHVKLQLSHLIFAGRASWSTAQESLRIIEDANRRGVDVMMDAFPYTYGNTTILAILPYWYIKKVVQGVDSLLDRARLKVEMELGIRLAGIAYKDIQLMDVGLEKWEEYNGVTIDKVARSWRVSSLETVVRLGKASKGCTIVLIHKYSGEPGFEQPLECVLSHDLCLFETDALVRSRGYPNPAAKGTFPKVLGECVREKQLFSLENAIERMTSKSAIRFGLKDRGQLAKGKAADVVVFDPQAIGETPPIGTLPAGRPKGVRHVFLNGQQVVSEGLYINGPLAGRVLKV